MKSRHILLAFSPPYKISILFPSENRLSDKFEFPSPNLGSSKQPEIMLMITAEVFR
jgi:hypothetical protein